MHSIRAWVQSAWAHRGPVACALWPLSLLYALVWHGRRLLYRQGWLDTWRAPVPVVIVGNVVAGGAGKTPVTLALLEHLRSRGWTPGVVSRGYGRRSTDTRLVAADSPPHDVGDEPLLIHRRGGVPVCVGRSRVQAVQHLLARHAEIDIVVADDGLQHLALWRDIEILVTDARLAGNGWLQPAGPLREPWPRRCDLWLHNGTDTPTGAWAVTRQLGSTLRRADGTTVSIDSLRGSPVHAVAGIAQPHAFFSALRARGLDLHQTVALPDHAPYADEDAAARWGAPLLCTEKDAVKLWRLRPDAWAAPLEVQLPAGAWAALDAVLKPRSGDTPLSSNHGYPTA